MDIMNSSYNWRVGYRFSRLIGSTSWTRNYQKAHGWGFRPKIHIIKTIFKKNGGNLAIFI